MKEPRPENVAAPLEEPILDVGVLLEEDARAEISVKAIGVSYQFLAGDSLKGLLPSGSHGRLRADGGSVSLSAEDGSVLVQRTNSITLVPSSAVPLTPQFGLELSALVAGRKFHWRKDVTLTFPGRLTVFASHGVLEVVNSVPFEDYCTCVIASEMGAECPAAFMQAQATAARSWGFVFLRNKHPGARYQVCNDDDCQRYQGTTFLAERVVANTASSRGRFLINPENAVCAAYYSKSCGGRSELPENCFGFHVPGISSVIDGVDQTSADLERRDEFQQWLRGVHPAQKEIYCSPAFISEQSLGRYLGAVDHSGAYYRWSRELSEDALAAILRDRFAPDLTQLREIEFGRRGVSGRILSAQVVYECQSGTTRRLILPDQYELRRALSPTFLLSSAFAHEWRVSSGRRELRLTGAGWGHGIGLCQIGAVGMALRGLDATQILSHYFPQCYVKVTY